MKKRIAASCCTLILAIGIVGCSASANTEKAIDNIGEVTLESADALNNANEQYEALSDEEKEKVDNYQTLEKANNRYSEILYSEISKLLEKTEGVESSFFATRYDIKNLLSARESAKTAIESSDEESYQDEYNNLKNETEKYNAFIEEELSNSYSQKCGSDETHPFAVDFSEITSGWAHQPIALHGSEYPIYFTIWDATTTDTLPDLGIGFSDNSWCYYSVEPTLVDTQAIEVQDEEGNLQTAYVNTMLTLHDSVRHTNPDNSRFQLEDGDLFLLTTPDHGLCFAVKDVINNKGYLLYSLK